MPMSTVMKILPREVLLSVGTMSLPIAALIPPPILLSVQEIKIMVHAVLISVFLH